MQRLFERLKGVKRVAGGVMALCPAHADKNPSLSVSKGDNGATLVKCHAGCSVEEVVKAAGLTMADLFPPKVPDAPPKFVKGYNYLTADGGVLFQVLRYEPKTFRQRRSDGNGGWIWSLRDLPRPFPLYRLPKLLAADKNTLCIYVPGRRTPRT